MIRHIPASPKNSYLKLKPQSKQKEWNLREKKTEKKGKKMMNKKWTQMLWHFTACKEKTEGGKKSEMSWKREMRHGTDVQYSSGRDDKEKCIQSRCQDHLCT